MKRICLYLFTVTLAACGAGNETKNNSAKGAGSDSAKTATAITPEKGWKVLDKPDYSVQYPENWTLQENQNGALFFLMAPVSADEARFNPNINLLSQDLSGQAEKIDLDKYTEISLGQIQTMIEGSKVLENKRISKNGMDFQKVVYSGDQKGMKLQFEQLYTIVNNKAWVFTFTALDDQFKALQENAEKILNSLHVKK